MDSKDQAALNNLATELGNDLPLIKRIIADYKEGGLKNVAAKDLGEVIKEGRADFLAVTAALPVIKSGWRTTEFWLVAIFAFGNIAFTAWKGTALPLEVNIAVGAVIAAYTAMRSIAKVKASAAPQPLPAIPAGETGAK